MGIARVCNEGSRQSSSVAVRCVAWKWKGLDKKRIKVLIPLRVFPLALAVSNKSEIKRERGTLHKQPAEIVIAPSTALQEETNPEIGVDEHHLQQP